MSIRSIQTHPLRIPYDVGGPKQEFMGHPRTHLEALFVRVETHDGVVGWGEAFGINMWPVVRVAIDQFIAPYATGKDEGEHEALLLDLKRRLHVYGRTGPVMYGLSALDIALWDIAGKRAQQPLHALLGGARRSALPAYASLMRYSEPRALARNCERSLQQGYRAVKIHETTLAQCSVARDALGPETDLMVDTNCAWSLEAALSYLPALERLNLRWLEEPTWPPENMAQLLALRAQATMPLSAGENAATPWELAQMAASGALSVLQPSVIKIGGISDLRAVAAAAPPSVEVVPHSPYFGPGYLATLHLAATFERETPVERLFCDFAEHPLAEAIVVEKGAVAVPMKPGLGFDPDPELLARFAA